MPEEDAHDWSPSEPRADYPDLIAHPMRNYMDDDTDFDKLRADFRRSAHFNFLMTIEDREERRKVAKKLWKQFIAK